MAIKRVEIKDFLVFKGKFAMDFCHGVNVFIGSNGTGKTTLLKALYAGTQMSSSDFIFGITDMQTEYENAKAKVIFADGRTMDVGIYTTMELFCALKQNSISKKWSAVYIPEKDMLSNAKGLPETVKYNKDKAQYTQTEIEIIEKARVRISGPEQPLYRKICDLIQAEPENDGESFFMRRAGIKKPIPFSSEASGYRKFGLLATLIRNEQIKPDSALFWDEPENSLNPELIPMLVDIILELARDGVQVFIATHSELLANYFLVNRKKSDEVMFYSLYKNGEHIKYDSNDRFDLLNPNKLTDEPVSPVLDSRVEKRKPIRAYTEKG
jgi:predicted ATP-dependent endonuclease of OLD family